MQTTLCGWSRPLDTFKRILENVNTTSEQEGLSNNYESYKNLMQIRKSPGNQSSTSSSANKQI